MANIFHKGDRVHLLKKPDSRSGYSYTWSPRAIYEVEQSYGDENGEVTLFETDRDGNVIRAAPLAARKKYVVPVNSVINAKFKIGDKVQSTVFSPFKGVVTKVYTEWPGRPFRQGPQYYGVTPKSGIEQINAEENLKLINACNNARFKVGDTVRSKTTDKYDTYKVVGFLPTYGEDIPCMKLDRKMSGSHSDYVRPDDCVLANSVTNAKFEVGDKVRTSDNHIGLHPGEVLKIVEINKNVNGKDVYSCESTSRPGVEIDLVDGLNKIIAVNDDIVDNAADSNALKIIMDSVKGYLDRRIKNDDAWRYPNYVITILRKVCDTATMSAGRYDNQRPKHRIYDIECTLRGRKFKGNLICTGLLHRDDPDDVSTFDEYDMTLSLMNVGKAPGTTNSVVANALAWKRGAVKNAIAVADKFEVGKVYRGPWEKDWLCKVLSRTDNSIKCAIKSAKSKSWGPKDEIVTLRINPSKTMEQDGEVANGLGWEFWASVKNSVMKEMKKECGINATVCNYSEFRKGRWIHDTRNGRNYIIYSDKVAFIPQGTGLEIMDVQTKKVSIIPDMELKHYYHLGEVEQCDKCRNRFHSIATNFRFAVTTKSGRSVTIEAPNYKAAEKEAERRFGKGSIVDLIGNAASTNRVINAAIHEEDEVMYDGGRYWVEEVSHDGKSVIISDAHGDTTVEVPVSRVKLVKQNSVCNAKFKVGDKVVVHWGDWRGDDPGTILERGSYGWVVAFDDLTPYKEVNERIITIRNSSTNPVVNAAITWKDKRDAVKDAERYAEIALKAAWSAYERGNSSRVQEILKDLESRGGISAEKAIRTIKQKFI